MPQRYIAEVSCDECLYVVEGVEGYDAYEVEAKVEEILSEGYHTEYGDYLCEDCWGERHTTCEVCGDWVEWDDSLYCDDVYFCSTGCSEEYHTTYVTGVSVRNAERVSIDTVMCTQCDLEFYSELPATPIPSTSRLLINIGGQ